MPETTPRDQTAHHDSFDETAAAWHRERPDLPIHTIGIVSRIWYLAKLLGEDRRRTLSEAGIDPAILDLLSVLRRSGPPYRLSTRELANRSLISPAATSQRLNRAEADGWVTRERLTDGSRGVLVTLTDAGSTTVDRYVERILRHEAELLADLTSDQADDLAILLRDLVASIEQRTATSHRSQVGVD